MPYTEDAAKFFYNMMIGMCVLADKISIFFDDEQNIVKAIEAGAVPLITSAQTGPTE